MMKHRLKSVKPDPSILKRDEMFREYLLGSSPEEIARRFRVSLPTVYRAARRDSWKKYKLAQDHKRLREISRKVEAEKEDLENERRSNRKQLEDGRWCHDVERLLPQGVNRFGIVPFDSTKVENGNT